MRQRPADGEASDWHGIIREIEDLDDDGHLTLIIDWYTLEGRPCDSSTDGMEFDEVEHLPIVEALAELGREVERRT